MKIFGLVNRNSGPSFHRIHMPLLLMPDVDAYITNGITPQDFEERTPDVIFYNRMVSDEVLLAAQNAKAKVVVDIDDWWELDKHHIAYDHYQKNKYGSNQIMHLLNADAVTCTHERLAEKIYPYNANVHIIPNAIPQHEYFPVKKTESELHRVFWQGSVTHEFDIALLRGTVRKLDPKRFKMVIAGCSSDPEWHRMVKNYTNVGKIPATLIKGTDCYSYYQAYEHADVCVAPLLSTRFNSMKSNLKVLEAAHSCLPCIASEVYPYIGLPILPVRPDRPQDWLKWLNDKEAQKENAVELKQYCERHYGFEVINQKRKEALEAS